jgi:polar amino acid transport system substrate-binding protein
MRLRTLLRTAACGALALSCLAPLQAANISMAFGEKIPPFCFPETDTGIELDVMREALAFRGHVLVPRYFSFARIPVAFKARDVDAAMTDLGEDMTAWGALYGDPAVYYDNMFFTLSERKLVIRKPEDLQGLSVLSFPGGAKRYPLWLDSVKRAGRYYEQNDQALQVLTLDRGRYDIILSDRNIFRYFTTVLKLNNSFRPKAVTAHGFVKLDPMDYRPVFWDKKVRDDFNAGLKNLKDTGRFEAIYQKYLSDGKGG